MTNYLQGVDLSTDTATYRNEGRQRYYWNFDCKLHRLDGPAIIYETDKEYSWWVDGKLHRLDGPAYIDELNKKYSWCQMANFIV